MNLNINIISSDNKFQRQYPSWGYDGYNFAFNSNDNIVWDMVVVYENTDKIFSLKYKNGGLIFISGEPPIVKHYSESYIRYFDHIISSHTNLNHPNNHLEQQALLWYLGYDFSTRNNTYNFDDLEKMEVPLKPRKISFITSNRDFLPGHQDRLRFYDILQKNYSNHIDFFGKGIQPIGDKADGLLPYSFSLCIENSCIDNYWTEKITDAFLAYTVPLCYGCSNISSYFDSKSFISIDIRRPKETFKTLDKIIENADDIYASMLPALLESRNKILYHYNIFPTLISIYERFVKETDSRNVKEVNLYPYDNYKRSKADIMLRIKRFILKKINYVRNYES